MPAPRRRDIVLRDNADFAIDFAFPEPGGRAVDDLVLTNGSPTVTSATAKFTTADTGKKLASVDGTGITDGTTMTYVDAQTVTLSANATADGVGVVGIVRAFNCSAFTTVGAQVKYKAGITTTTVLAFTVDDTRNAVGIYTISAPAASIAASVTADGHWDWLMTSSAGDMVWYEGKVTFKKGVVHRP